jgi:hypothetical protein
VVPDVEELTILQSRGTQQKIAFLVQKIKGFLKKEDKLLFFFEHKEEGYDDIVLTKQMNKQLFYIEEMLAKQITKN